MNELAASLEEPYEEDVAEYVKGLVCTVYRELWEQIELDGQTRDGHTLPFIGEICELLWTDIISEIQIDLIDEAIERGDHEEIYGYTETEFFAHAFDGEITSDALDPEEAAQQYMAEVIRFLFVNHIYFLDYYDNPQNCPVLEVW